MCSVQNEDTACPNYLLVQNVSYNIQYERIWIVFLALIFLFSNPLKPVGNKCEDLSRKQVETADARRFSEQMGVRLFETSAKENLNVEEVLEEVVRRAKVGRETEAFSASRGDGWMELWAGKKKIW